MPYRSKAQQRFIFAAEERGDVPKGTAKKWAEHTKNIKSLPEHVKKAEEDLVHSFYKIAKELLSKSKNLPIPERDMTKKSIAQASVVQRNVGSIKRLARP